jgi:curved DNA-binding protein CbpA
MVYHPDRLDQRLEPLRNEVQRIFTRLTEAHSVLSDENRRREYLSILSQGGEAAVKRRADEAAAEAGRAITADEHFKKGQMALRRSMFPAAVEEFQAAVELYDGEADYYAHLAWAKWCNATDKQSAFAEVKGIINRALQLNNKCVDALYFRGQMFSALGENDKAYRSFQIVLQYKDDHVEAAREIRLMEMRKKGGRGLFDRFRKK